MNEPRILPLNGGKRPGQKALKKFALVFQDKKTVFHLEAEDYFLATISSEDAEVPLAYHFKVGGKTVLEMQANEILHVVDTDAVDLQALLNAIKPKPQRKKKE